MWPFRFEIPEVALGSKIFSLTNLILSPARARLKDAVFGAAVQSLIFLVVFLALAGLSTPARGAGFTIFQQGTGAMAQGSAFVAEADDPSAIFYNPAGLHQLKRPELYLGGFFNHPDREFHGPAGQSAETNHRWFTTGTAYLTYPFNEHVAGGIGFFSPFGLGSQWPPTWEGRYITTWSSLKTYTINPVISLKPIDCFSLAFGFDAMWSDVELKRKLPIALGPLVLPDGEARQRGDGKGFGYNVGALWEVVKGVQWGLSYRSQIAVNFTGNLDLTLPSQVPGPRQIPGSAKLTFPPFVTTGISVSRFQPFTFNFDVTWTGWSTFDQFKVNLVQPILVNARPAANLYQPKNWKDTWTFRFGMNYRLTESIKLRAGYAFDQSPVPDETFDPQVPNANQHIFAVGGDWGIKGFTLGLAYNYILGESRNKNNAIPLNGVPFPLQANGRYQSDVHSLGVSLAYKF